MSMKKMRLVSEAVYGKLFNLEHDPSTQLAKDKSSILHDPSIPEEVKPLLYNQMVRQISSKVKNDHQTPTQVAWDEDDDESKDVKDKKELFKQWLETAGMSIDKQNNLVVYGKPTKNANINRITDQLLGIESPQNVAGLTAIYNKMSDRGMSKDFFRPSSQKGSGASKGKKRQWNKNRSSQIKKISWKKY